MPKSTGCGRQRNFPTRCTRTNTDGLDPTVWQLRHKTRRDRCLLHLRLRDNPHDAVAYCYLALMARRDQRPIAARTFARRALECGPRTLHDDRVAQLHELLSVYSER
jgi:hypothetical protein